MEGRESSVNRLLYEGDFCFFKDVLRKEDRYGKTQSRPLIGFDAQAHVEVIFDVVAVETKSILKAFFVEYRTLIKKCTPNSNFKKLFPKSYYKVVKFKNNGV